MDIMNPEKMDTLGREGYESFAKYYKRVWEDYCNYGEVVLSKNFGEKDENELKLLSRNANKENFREKLYEFWVAHYLIIIKTYQDLEEAYWEMRFNENYRIYSDKCVGFKSWNIKPRVVISEKLLKEINDKMERYSSSNVYIKCQKNMYLVYTGSDGSINCIRVAAVIPLESILS